MIKVIKTYKNNKQIIIIKSRSVPKVLNKIRLIHSIKIIKNKNHFFKT